MIVNYERDGNSFTLDTATLTPAGVDYLLQYGFAQSLQDSVAGEAKRVRAERAKAGDTESEIVEAISEAIAGKLGKRYDSIAASEMGLPSTREPLAALAKELVNRKLAKEGKKVSKERLAELVAEAVENKRDLLVAELARRKALEIDVEVDV